MKRISIIGILCIILTLVTLNVNAEVLYEGDLSSSAGWKISNNISHAANRTSDYNPNTHTTVSFSDGVMNVGGTWYAHMFFPQTYTTGVVEAEFKLKRNDGMSTVDFMSTGGYTLSAIYVNGVISINHQDGDAATGANGVSMMKLLRRETDEWHDYVVRIDMDNQCAEYSVDGETFENIPFTPWGSDIYKIVFERASVKDLKISHYYEVDIEKDGFVTENIYNDGEVTIKSVSELPENSFLAAGVYKGDKLVSVIKGNDKSISINAADGDTIKAFLWKDESFTPLTKGVVSADEISVVSETGKELLYNYEKDNSDSGFDFSTLSNTEILDEEDVLLYDRETPDGTKYLRRNEYEKNIGTHGSWYNPGTHDEKEQNLLDLAYATGVKFADGVQIANNNALYYIRTGDIAKAEELIANNAGHQHVFTDVTQYYMYFKYGDLLSDEAKANLKSTIKAEFKRSESQGFAWYGGTYGRLGINHNQGYDGLVRGLFYAYAFMDDENEAQEAVSEGRETPEEVFEICNDILDKMVAATAASGTAIEEYNSQNYGGVVWSYVLALADLLPEGSEQKAKAELILNRMEAEQAVLYHPQTVTTVAPHARSGFNYVSGITAKQGIPLMLYGLSTREGYWQNNEATSYTFFYSQLASVTHKLKDYTESIAYDKEYPKSVNMTYRRISTPDAYLIDAGNQSLDSEDAVFKHANTVGYMTESYSMGSAPETPWYIPGLRGQETTFLARWTRDDTPDSLSDIPALFSYYRYDIGKESGATEDPNYSYFTPEEQGLSATVQHENKAIVYSYPGKVTDEKLAANLGVADYTKGLDFYNMGTSIYITNPEDTKIYVDAKKICDEEIITTNGNRELRAKLDKLPYTAENPKGNIYLEDKSIYAAIIPLNASAVQIRDLTADVRNNTDNEYTTQIKSAYSINLLNNSFDTLSTLKKENFDAWATANVTTAVAEEHGYTGGANGGQIKIVEDSTEDKSIALRTNGAVGKTFDTPYTEHFNINYNGTVSETYGDSGTVANGIWIYLENSKETDPYKLYLQLSDLGNLLYIRKNDGTAIKVTEYKWGIIPVETDSPWTEIYPTELLTAKDNEINIDVDIKNKLLTITLVNSNGTSTYSKALPDEVTGVSGFDLFAKDTVTQTDTDLYANYDDIEYHSNFTEAQRHNLRNGYIFEIAEKSEYATIDDFIDHIEQATYTTSESNNIWTTEYTSGDDTIKLCFDTNNLYVTESYANGVAQKHAFSPVYSNGKYLYAKSADEDYYYWNKSDFYKQNPTVFKSDNLIQSQAAQIKIGDCTLTNTDEAMVYVIYSPQTKTYVVGDLTAGENSYTLTTPYGTVEINNLNLGYVEFDGETKEISLNTTDSTATAVVQQ